MAPILGVVFEVASSNLPYAIILLLAFGIGHCSIIVLAGTMSKKVQEYLNWTENSKVVSYIKKICGVLVILGGIYMIYITY
ncbi:MAG: hypothetical protein ISS16_07390 [Ignavibacteria bacterium]|nr:hypothetical protein [Ignavibacteria bacterium]